jgi:hypothetical protein
LNAGTAIGPGRGGIILSPGFIAKVLAPAGVAAPGGNRGDGT